MNTERMPELRDHIRAFSAAVFEVMGSEMPDEEIIPGKIIRFDDRAKSTGNQSCWAVLYLDGCAVGVFGNWRTRETHTWRANNRPTSREDREQTRRIIKAAKRKREREIAERQKAAAANAREMWARATPATGEHPYIATKRVPALGVRVVGRALLIPLRTVEGELVNLQRIYPDGCKLQLKGGRIRGCFYLLPTELPHQGELYICEGWATAATIHAQTRLPVAAAMNTGNLLPVAQAIHAAHPRLNVVIAGDNDHRTHGNPGLRYAREAARAIDGAVTWPTVCGAADCCCTDFNDVQNCRRAPK
jgi:putative DNA primase/helicase